MAISAVSLLRPVVVLFRCLPNKYLFMWLLSKGSCLSLGCAPSPHAARKMAPKTGDGSGRLDFKRLGAGRRPDANQGDHRQDDERRKEAVRGRVPVQVHAAWHRAEAAKRRRSCQQSDHSAQAGPQRLCGAVSRRVLTEGGAPHSRGTACMKGPLVSCIMYLRQW